jgi:hypothetical protein
MTIYGFWIGDRICWNLCYRTRDFGTGLTENTVVIYWEHVCLRIRYSATAIVYFLTSRSFPNSGSVSHNANLELREIGWRGMEWIDLAQDKNQWRSHVYTAMNLRVL